MFDSNSSTVHFSPFLQLADCSLPKHPFKHSQIFYDYYRDFYTGFSVIKYFWLIQNGRFKMEDVSSTLFDNKCGDNSGHHDMTTIVTGY